MAPQVHQALLGHGRDLAVAEEDHTTAGGAIDAAEQVEQRRLAAPGPAGHGDHLAGR